MGLRVEQGIRRSSKRILRLVPYESPAFKAWGECQYEGSIASHQQNAQYSGMFLGGVVAPSFLRSGMSAKHGSVGGSLHVLTIGGVTFGFTLENLGFALLGGVFGTLIALSMILRKQITLN